MPSKPLEPNGLYKLFWLSLMVVSGLVFVWSFLPYYTAAKEWWNDQAELAEQKKQPPKLECGEGYQPMRAQGYSRGFRTAYEMVYSIPPHCKTKWLVLPGNARNFYYRSNQELVITMKFDTGKELTYVYRPTEPKQFQNRITGLRFTNDFDGDLHVRVSAE